MSENQVNSISRVDMDGPSRLAMITAQSVEVSQKQFAQSKSASIATKSENQEHIMEKVSQAVNQRLSPMNTTLKFQIDDETNDITVLIVDRATDKILHTIPAEAIKNIPAGQLMQYFA
ncbi:MAG: flagellar protein FlaG [Anaerolineaceae bacterium]|nr:flagellar protein FlaG [Anaerolineaceae bacterium]